MIPSFNQQSSKNIGVLEDTLLRLVQSLRRGTLAKYGYSCADAAIKSLNIRKVPGLVALPNIKRSDYEKEMFCNSFQTMFSLKKTSAAQQLSTRLFKRRLERQEKIMG